MGAIVAIIGLELAPVAMGMAGLIGDQNLGMSHEQAIIVSMFSLIVTLLGTVVFRGFLAVIPVLIGVVAGYILSAIMALSISPLLKRHHGSRYHSFMVCLNLISMPSS